MFKIRPKDRRGGGRRVAFCWRVALVLLLLPVAVGAGMNGPGDPLVQGAQPPVARVNFAPGAVFASFLIKGYRAVISPARGMRCPMLPTCSEYSRRAFQTHGVLVGICATGDRLLRCAADLRFYRMTLTPQGISYVDSLR